MVTLDVKTPFSFAQTLAFISRFPPCPDACLMGAASLASAVAIGGRAHAFTLREHAGGIVCGVDDRTPAATRPANALHADRLNGPPVQPRSKPWRLTWPPGTCSGGMPTRKHWTLWVGSDQDTCVMS